MALAIVLSFASCAGKSTPTADSNPVAVTVVSADGYRSGGEYGIDFLISIKNNAKEDIVGVKGELHFFNEGEFMLKFQADFIEAIEAKKSQVFDTFSFTTTTATSNALRIKYIEAMTAYFKGNLSYEYFPSLIMFADGTFIEY